MSTALADQPAPRDRGSEEAPQAAAPTPQPLRRTDDRAFVRKGPLVVGMEAVEPGRSNATGFLAIGEDLERRSREWSKMVRLLQQNREFLDSAETERDAAYAELERVIPFVQETSRELESAMDACRSGEELTDLTNLFVRNGEALDQLERVAVALTGHFLRCRSAWDQYTRNIAIAQRLRAEMQGAGAV
jgi:hypothetical protein